MIRLEYKAGVHYRYNHAPSNALSNTPSTNVVVDLIVGLYDFDVFAFVIHHGANFIQQPNGVGFTQYDINRGVVQSGQTHLRTVLIRSSKRGVVSI